MKKFEVRTKAGELKAVVSPHIGGNMLVAVPGYWRSVRLEKGPEQAYIVDMDCKYTFSFGVNNVDIYLWVGDRISIK